MATPGEQQDSILDTLSPAQRDQFAEFARMLIAQNRVLNLTAVDSPDAVRIRHFEDSLAALPVLQRLATSPTPRLIDIGSGGGLPGLALAIALPDWSIVSVEATGKKTRFQDSVVQALGLTNVTIIQDRAETLGHDPAHRELYDFATARALASLAELAELALPFVRVGGSLVAWKGPRAEEEIAEAAAALEKLGGGFAEQVEYDLPLESDEARRFRLVILEKQSPCSERFPRSAAAIQKRPLT